MGVPGASLAIGRLVCTGVGPRCAPWGLGLIGSRPHCATVPHGVFIPWGSVNVVPHGVSVS